MQAGEAMVVPRKMTAAAHKFLNCILKSGEDVRINLLEKLELVVVDLKMWLSAVVT